MVKVNIPDSFCAVHLEHSQTLDMEGTAYVYYQVGKDNIILDGEFSFRQLKELIQLIEEHKNK